MLRRDSTLAMLARPIYRRLRTAYLRRRFPSGHFVSGTGIRVFCDFSDPSYVWYDADSDYLRFHRAVFEALIDRSVGNIFVDIGAHFGFYTALIAETARRARRAARIIAVEPDRHHFDCLQRTVERFVNDEVRVDLVPAAIGGHDGVVSLYKTSASCLHSYPEEPGAVACYEVPLVTLDSLVKARLALSERSALIKIDGAGAEPFVFDGWPETMKGHQPLVLTEFSPVAIKAAGRDPAALFAWLCAHFHVIHVNHVSMRIDCVREDDYADLVTHIGAGVTDLIISTAPLDRSILSIHG